MASNEKRLYLSYRCCVVPMCTNTTIKTPSKIFLNVPKNPVMRRKWCKLMNKNKKVYRELGCNSTLHCCEDHFNPQKVMDSHVKYRITGSVKKIRINSGPAPIKMQCQKNLPKSRHKHVILLKKGAPQQKTADEVDVDMARSDANTTKMHRDQLTNPSGLQISTERDISDTQENQDGDTATVAQCRLCAAHRAQTSVIDMSDDVILLQFKGIIDFFKIDYIDLSPQSALPKTVCMDCYKTVCDAFTFFKNVEQTQLMFNSVDASQIKSEPDETEYVNVENAYDDNMEVDVKEEIVDIDLHLDSVGAADDVDRLVTLKEETVEPDGDEGSNSVQNSAERVEDKSWTGYELCCIRFHDAHEIKDQSNRVSSTSGTFKCIDCFDVYYDFDTFVEHVRQHRSYLRHYCQYCNDYFEDVKNLGEHIAKHKTCEDLAVTGSGALASETSVYLIKR